MKITFDVSIEELTELIDAILDKDFECDCCDPCCDCDRKCEETEECTYYDTASHKIYCEKCGKEVDIIDAELLPFKRHAFIICSDCLDKIEKFIKESED